ncbi:hypothetical protein KBC03_07310 [Patescibacteria group bacterium]|nr:hypothetical protein [Patescibacteria group bacterium]
MKNLLNPTSGLIIGNVGANCVTNGAFSGDIAELITFNRRLEIWEANMVNSYLALKYAITLDQTTGHDYTLSGGLTAWSRISA